MLYMLIGGICIGCFGYYSWDAYMNFSNVFMMNKQQHTLQMKSFRFRSGNPLNLLHDIKELILNRTFDIDALKMKNMLFEQLKPNN